MQFHFSSLYSPLDHLCGSVPCAIRVYTVESCAVHCTKVLSVSSSPARLHSGKHIQHNNVNNKINVVPYSRKIRQHLYLTVWLQTDYLMLLEFTFDRAASQSCDVIESTIAIYNAARSG